MSVDIVYGNEKYFKSLHECLGAVAQERIYIEMVEAPPLESVVEFQSRLIEIGAPLFYAVENNVVVGWADICPVENPRMVHRGCLGIGLLPKYRGQGLGKRLLQSAIGKAHEFGLEKIELTVYTHNSPAVALYKKLGFFEEGMIKKYRKLDGKYFDVFHMGLFL